METALFNKISYPLTPPILPPPGIIVAGLTVQAIFRYMLSGFGFLVVKEKGEKYGGERGGGEFSTLLTKLFNI